MAGLQAPVEQSNISQLVRCQDLVKRVAKADHVLGELDSGPRQG